MPNTVQKKYTPEHPLTIYDLARSGASDAKISAALGITELTFRRWRDSKPEVRAAIDKGRLQSKQLPGINVLAGYVLDRLPADLVPLWNEIKDLGDQDKHPNAVKRLEAIFQEHGERVQQQMFLNACLAFTFNISRARRLVNISKSTLDRWIETDADFADLVDEIETIKCDFYEECLVFGCQRGEASLIKFANETKNAKRGYKRSTEVTVSGEVNHMHDLHQLDDLNMPVEVMREALDALRRKQAAARGLREHVPDAEILNVKESK